MATQEQVNALQADLLAAERAYKAASRAIVEAADAEALVVEPVMVYSRNAALKSMRAFHAFADYASNLLGITTESVGPDKD